MAKARVTKHYNSFIKGQISDGNEFSAPDNAVKAMLNMELQVDGTLRRRRGLSFDASPAVWNSNGSSSWTVSEWNRTFEWEFAGGFSDRNYTVAVHGARLSFYKREQGGALSSAFISNLAVDTGTVLSSTDFPLSLAHNAGYVVTTYPGRYPHLVTSTGVDVFSYSLFTPKVRDLIGANDGLAVDAKPSVARHTVSGTLTGFAPGDVVTGATSGFKAIVVTGTAAGSPFRLMYIGTSGFINGEIINSSGGGSCTHTAYLDGTGMSVAHYYNLENQGWTYANILKYVTGTYFYPSNAQIMSAGKDATGVFSAAELDKVTFGTAPAPKGHYLIDPTYPVRSFTDPIAGGVKTISATRGLGYSACTFFASRLVFLGGTSGATASEVFVSQLLENTVTDASDPRFLLDKCYSVNDLTAEENNQTLPTDGFSVIVAGASRLLAAVPLGKGLLLLGENGVWFMRGTDAGFSSQDFEIVRVSNNGTVSPNSVVIVEEAALYWGRDGIYSVAVDPTGFSVSSQELTNSRIRLQYHTFTENTRKSATGFYDPYRKHVHWAYDASGSGPSSKLSKLLLDVGTMAFQFQDYQIGSDYSVTRNYRIAGYTQQRKAITAGEAPLVQTVVLRQLAASNTDSTVAIESERKFFDWSNASAYFTSYVELWPEHAGTPHAQKQVEFLYAFFRRTETYFVDNGLGGVTFDYPSSALFKAAWDWKPFTGTEEVTAQEELYRFERPYISGGIGDPFNYGESVIKTLNIVPGEGNAVAFRLDAANGKDMHILGLSVGYSGEVKVEQ